MRHWITLLCVFAIGLGALSCGDKGGEGKEFTLAVMPKGESHEFWQSMHAGAYDAARELGNVEIVWQGPATENETKAQIELFARMRAKNIDGIVIAPCDRNAFVKPIERAMGDKLPVVVVDSDVNTQERTSFIATDNIAWGRKAGEKLIELMGGSGNVMLLTYKKGVASTDDRVAGFRQAIEANPDVQIVLEGDGGADVTSAIEKTSQLIQKMRDEGAQIDGVFTPNESTTLGMLNVLEDEDLAGKIVFHGWDPKDKINQALAEGKIDALMVQDPYKMGYLGVMTCIDALKGEDVESRIDTGGAIVTSDTMDEHDDLLNPKRRK